MNKQDTKTSWGKDDYFASFWITGPLFIKEHIYVSLRFYIAKERNLQCKLINMKQAQNNPCVRTSVSRVFNLLSLKTVPQRLLASQHQRHLRSCFWTLIFTKLNFDGSPKMRSKTVSLPQLSLLTEDGEERSLGVEIEDSTGDNNNNSNNNNNNNRSGCWRSNSQWWWSRPSLSSCTKIGSNRQGQSNVKMDSRNIEQ